MSTFSGANRQGIRSSVNVLSGPFAGALATAGWFSGNPNIKVN